MRSVTAGAQRISVLIGSSRPSFLRPTVAPRWACGSSMALVGNGIRSYRNNARYRASAHFPRKGEVRMSRARASPAHLISLRQRARRTAARQCRYPRALGKSRPFFLKER